MSLCTLNRKSLDIILNTVATDMRLGSNISRLDRAWVKTNAMRTATVHVDLKYLHAVLSAGRHPGDWDPAARRLVAEVDHLVRDTSPLPEQAMTASLVTASAPQT